MSIIIPGQIKKTSLILQENIKEITSKIKYPNKNFIGYFKYYTYFFADYLNYKYTNICAYRKNILTFNNINLQIQDNFTSYNIMDNSKIRMEFVNNILNCKKRFTMIPITFLGHQNILLYDYINKELDYLNHMVQ